MSPSLLPLLPRSAQLTVIFQSPARRQSYWHVVYMDFLQLGGRGPAKKRSGKVWTWGNPSPLCYPETKEEAESRCRANSGSRILPFQSLSSNNSCYYYYISGTVLNTFHMASCLTLNKLLKQRSAGPGNLSGLPEVTQVSEASALSHRTSPSSTCGQYSITGVHVPSHFHNEENIGTPALFF